MKYTSTRNSSVEISASEAILKGISPDGGLFLPTEFPKMDVNGIKALLPMSYPKRAAHILGLFLTDFSGEELSEYTNSAYSSARFTAATPAPVVKVGDSMHILELFHGPTSAFKDFALQILPYLLTASANKNGVKEEVVILVATSGDTGKAALEGFADVDGTSICVFYPKGGTSKIQELQMVTQAGKNVLVTGVVGNFDDAQTGVKKIFTDGEYAKELAAHGLRLSSANSINWGRLAPQIAYYFSAYCDMVNSGSISLGDSINIAVPTGNFGNILAAYIARECGLPVNKFICASNSNNVLTEFISTGVYNRNRPFHLTTSPSMDILISSNLERLLYMLSGSDCEVKGYMESLGSEGSYQVSPGLKESIGRLFDCGFADDSMAADSIKEIFSTYGYLADPHTAVAINVYQQYAARTGDPTPTVIASTASPFKFPGSVLDALGMEKGGDDFDMLNAVSEISGRSIPPRLAELKNKAVRFEGAVRPDEMKQYVSQLMK